MLSELTAVEQWVESLMTDRDREIDQAWMDDPTSSTKGRYQYNPDDPFDDGYYGKELEPWQRKQAGIIGRGKHSRQTTTNPDDQFR